ncbi:MAG: hypothetical protein ACP5D7_08685 [Limnospira sp.]
MSDRCEPNWEFAPNRVRARPRLMAWMAENPRARLSPGRWVPDGTARLSPPGAGIRDRNWVDPGHLKLRFESGF